MRTQNKNDGCSFFILFHFMCLFLCIFYDKAAAISEIEMFLLGKTKSKPTTIIKQQKNLNFINGILLKNLRTAINFNYPFYRFFSCN